MTNLDASLLDISELGSEHTLHSGRDLLDSVIDDPVKADINTVTGSIFCGNRIRSYVESYV